MYNEFENINLYLIWAHIWLIGQPFCCPTFISFIMFYSSLASLICCASFPAPPFLVRATWQSLRYSVLNCFALVLLLLFFPFGPFGLRQKGCGKSVMHAASAPKQTATYTTLTLIHTHTLTQIAALFFWGMLPFRPLLAHALVVVVVAYAWGA